MPDFHSPEDEATLYVLGELTVADRRKFEARLAESAELRALVRELEEGAVALSTALPQRQAPAEVWSGIEKIVCRDNQRNTPAWWMSFWRSGWAAAAVCLAGWVLYAILWNGRGNSRPATTQSVMQSEIPIANSSPAQQAVTILPSLTNADRQLLQVRAGEIRDLHLKVTEMERETNELSQLLAQERARLGESNRIKFYHLTSASAASSDAAAPQFSPAMQRAVLISIGRELGWYPVEPKSRVGNSRAANTVDGIDFVDLRSPNNGGTQPVGQPQTESQTADVPAPSIPAFVSGDKLIVGLDSTIVPPNSSVTVTVASANASSSGGSFVTGDNPTVVTVPLSVGTASDSGFAVTLYSVSPSGIPSTNQFFAPISP